MDPSLLSQLRLPDSSMSFVRKLGRKEEWYAHLERLCKTSVLYALISIRGEVTQDNIRTALSQLQKKHSPLQMIIRPSKDSYEVSRFYRTISNCYKVRKTDKS